MDASVTTFVMGKGTINCNQCKEPIVRGVLIHYRSGAESGDLHFCDRCIEHPRIGPHYELHPREPVGEKG